MKRVINAADPRVKRTRTLLQQTFMELLRDRDFAAVSVQDIVAKATVNRTTFYAHFEDKYALMDTILRDYFRQDVIAKLPPTARFTPENLYALTVAVFEFLAQIELCRPRAGTALPLFEGAVQQELQAYLVQWLDQETQGAVRANLLSWAIWGAGLTWSRQPSRPAVTTVATQVVTLLLEGMGNRLDNVRATGKALS